jgi:hypothetical protein
MVNSSRPLKPSNDWKSGYKRAVLNAFVKHAYALKPGAENQKMYSQGAFYYGGAENYTMTETVRNHLKSCSIDPVVTSMPEGCGWTDFAGTFATSDYNREGIKARVSCKCGVIRKVWMRMEGQVGVLIEAVLAED